MVDFDVLHEIGVFAYRVWRISTTTRDGGQFWTFILIGTAALLWLWRFAPRLRPRRMYRAGKGLSEKSTMQPLTTVRNLCDNDGVANERHHTNTGG